MQTVKKVECNRKEFELVDITKLLKMQCPTLVSALEARYSFFKENIKPSELLDNFANLEREEQFELSGWIYGGCQHLIDSLGFCGALDYLNLSTLHMMKKLFGGELEQATTQEMLAFEDGYNCALKVK